MSGDDLLHHPVDTHISEMRPVESEIAGPGPSGSRIQSWFDVEAQPGPSNMDVQFAAAAQQGEGGVEIEDGSVQISANEVQQLKTMLDRLDEMQVCIIQKRLKI